MNKLEQQIDLLVKKLKDINWDEQNELFRSTLGYNHQANVLVVPFEDGIIEYSFAEFIYEFAHENEEGESTEGIHLIRPYCEAIFRIMSKLLDRISSQEAKMKFVGNMEDKLRRSVLLGLNAVPSEFQEDMWALFFTIIEDFDREFKEISILNQMMILMKQDAVLNKYPVFKWNASQADLFRYIQLGIDLELLEDSRAVIGDFLSKYVVCYNKGAEQHVAISPKELKSTFYKTTRHQANQKFLKKLIMAIKSKYPELLPD
jgi:hypothetical protein